jgi:hypothetical protein
MGKHSYNIIRIKAKNGTTYAYEDYSYWDKERGYSTHKRRSIGKVLEDGTIAYNKYYLSREEDRAVEKELPDETVVEERSEESPVVGDGPEVSYTIRVGQKMVLDKVCEGTSVRRSLLDAFSVEDTDSILALAYYTVCRGKAFCHSEDWLEARGYADLGLTSQRISELLASISDDRQNAFFKSWMARQGRGDSMLFDITSVSTYGKGNPYAERGYNRDHENLEQVNL